MAATDKNIKLEFFSSNLSNAEAKQAEFTGMVVLASDFINTRKVNKATDLERISKLSVPIYLSKTKGGKFIAMNPSAENSVKIPLMQLPSLEELTTFVSDPSNLDLDKLYKKLLKFEIQEADLKGGFNSRQLKMIEEILKSPRVDSNDFTVLQPMGDREEIKKQLGYINNLVYDDVSMDKAIAERMKIVETALTEEAKEYKLRYDERAAFWKAEISNASTNLKKRLKERDTQLESDKKALKKTTDVKIQTETKNFFAGVAKNMRKDEVHIEKGIQGLETIAKKAASPENVEQIKKILAKLRDDTNTFIADIDFQVSKVRNLSNKKTDFMQIYELEEKDLVIKAERDKNILIAESKDLEKNRDKELNLLKADRDAAQQRLAQFKDRKVNWGADIKESLGGKGTPMLPESALRLNNPAKLVELHIPMYVFQYRKNESLYTVAVPPVKLPNSMKSLEKGSFNGEHKTVHFIPTVAETQNLVSQWLEKASEQMDVQTVIQGMDNLLDDPTQIRNKFFDSNNLMVNKLKVNKKKLSQANERLTTVFSAN